MNPTRIAFVGEVIDPDQRSRTVEVVFTGALLGAVTATHLGTGEPGTTPEWVDRTRLSQIALKPPIAGYLPAMMHPQRSTARYLGNLWRPDRAAPDPVIHSSAGGIGDGRPSRPSTG